MTTDRSMPFDPVLVVGTGLVGTSIALALRESGVSVWLRDPSPSALGLAVDYGAGEPWQESHGQPQLCVVAAPPDVTAEVVLACLAEFPEAIVIDVASVKSEIVEAVGDTPRFLGTHPMAGRERGGAMAARVDLFTGRPWILTPTASTPAGLVAQVTAVLEGFSSTVHQMSPADHDEAVAAVSHLPQVVATAMAARLHDVAPGSLDLAGQGLRDVTRIAASDVGLWLQILTHNAPFVTPLLRDVISDLSSLLSALSEPATPDATRAIAELLGRGSEGVAKIPGKHGGSTRFASLVVVIDDRPGQLARLLHDVGSLEVNLEDMTLDHSPGAPVGFVELSVLPQAVHQLALDLGERGWTIAGERR